MTYKEAMKIPYTVVLKKLRHLPDPAFGYEAHIPALGHACYSGAQTPEETMRDLEKARHWVTEFRLQYRIPLPESQ